MELTFKRRSELSKANIAIDILIFPITTEEKTSIVAPVVVVSYTIGCCFTGEFTYEMIDSFYQLRDHAAYQQDRSAD